MAKSKLDSAVGDLLASLDEDQREKFALVMEQMMTLARRPKKAAKAKKATVSSAAPPTPAVEEPPAPPAPPVDVAVPTPVEPPSAPADVVVPTPPAAPADEAVPPTPEVTPANPAPAPASEPVRYGRGECQNRACTHEEGECEARASAAARSPRSTVAPRPVRAVINNPCRCNHCPGNGGRPCNNQAVAYGLCKNCNVPCANPECKNTVPHWRQGQVCNRNPVCQEWKKAASIKSVAPVAPTTPALSRPTTKSALVVARPHQGNGQLWGKKCHHEGCRERLPIGPVDFCGEHAYDCDGGCGRIVDVRFKKCGAGGAYCKGKGKKPEPKQPAPPPKATEAAPPPKVDRRAAKHLAAAQG